MYITIDETKYEVVITRKNIKNMYMRIKEDKKIYISCHYLVTSGFIRKFIDNNILDLKRMIERIELKEEKNKYFNYLGNKYNIVISNLFKTIEFDNDKVYAKEEKSLGRFLEKESLRVFNERLQINYSLFEENIPYPKLMIRKMKKKWGYCNKRDNLIKLNFELIKYSIDEIDYVIIHELSHFVHFNHSKEFWKLVKKYKPDYKTNQNILKEA